MKTFVAVLVIQLALVQCADEVKRAEDDQGFIYDKDFAKTCFQKVGLKQIPNAQNRIKGKKPPVTYMYPCNNCKMQDADYGQSNSRKQNIFYKYDKETDFFEVANYTLTVTKYRYECECNLDANDEEITKSIDTFKKDNLDSTCDKLTPTKEKAFEVDPDKVKACFQSKQKDSMAKISVSQEDLDILVSYQEEYYKDGIKKKATYIILQTELKPPNRPLDVSGGNNDLVQCLKEAHFFEAFPYALVDVILGCGNSDKQLFFTEGADYAKACRQILRI